MTALIFTLWLLNMAVDTGGQLAFKGAALQGLDLDLKTYWLRMAKRPLLWLGIILYVAEFFIWMAFLSQVALSSGIMLGCINIVAIMLAGHRLYNESLTPRRVAGILLITLGVMLVGLGA